MYSLRPYIYDEIYQIFEEELWLLLAYEAISFHMSPIPDISGYQREVPVFVSYLLELTPIIRDIWNIQELICYGIENLRKSIGWRQSI